MLSVKIVIDDTEVRLFLSRVKVRYSRTSLSRLRLSRITAYLEAKIWSLIKHKNLTTGNKILWKRGEIAPIEQFLLFCTIFSICPYLRSQIKYSFMKCGCSDYIGLNSANLLCRGTDISKYFRESLGLRDNESRLYLACLGLEICASEPRQAKTIRHIYA